MKDFGYCLWLCPLNGNALENYTNGFRPHVTIKSNLHLSDAIELKESIGSVRVLCDIGRTQIRSVIDDFYSIYYKVFTDKPYWWWPENAHISFKYEYGYINNSPIELPKWEVTLYDMVVMDCRGHFSSWKPIN